MLVWWFCCVVELVVFSIPTSLKQLFSLFRIVPSQRSVWLICRLLHKTVPNVPVLGNKLCSYSLARFFRSRCLSIPLLTSYKQCLSLVKTAYHLFYIVDLTYMRVSYHFISNGFEMSRDDSLHGILYIKVLQYKCGRLVYTWFVSLKMTFYNCYLMDSSNFPHFSRRQAVASKRWSPSQVLQLVFHCGNPSQEAG